MVAYVVVSVVSVLLLGVKSDVCETGNEEASILQIARTPVENANFANAVLAETPNLSSVADGIFDSSMTDLQKSLKIASDLAAKLHLPNTTDLIMPHIHKQGGGSGLIVDSAKLIHESKAIAALLNSDIHDLDTMKLSDELATTLGICEAGASGKKGQEHWGQIMCSIRCSSASAVAGVVCGMSDDCSASLEEAIKVCAACPSQICTSPWLKSTVSSTDACKVTHDVGMVAVSSAVAQHAAERTEWEVEEDVLEKLYRSTTMNPLSRSVLLEKQVAEMLLTCQEGAEHAQLVSLAQGEAGFWGWFKPSRWLCYAGCTGAVLGVPAVCLIAGKVTLGAACAGALFAAMGTCGECPDVMCHSPMVRTAINVGCSLSYHTFKPACDFCHWR